MAINGIHGEIFPKEKADEMYGPVLESVKFSVIDLKNIMAKTIKNIMFKFEDGKLYIFDQKRNLIFSNSGDPKFGPEVVLKIYSLSVLEKLISNAETAGNAFDISVERREKVISVSTSIETMEVCDECPPICD